jgi:hypothetical protein
MKKETVQEKLDSGEFELVRELTVKEIDWYDRLNIRHRAIDEAMAVALNKFQNSLAQLMEEMDGFWSSITGEGNINFRNNEYAIGQHEGRMVLVKETNN